MADTATKPRRRKAPSPEKSDLPCTHLSCNLCDHTEPYYPAFPHTAWSCELCGCEDVDEVIFEHHSPTPLGFIDDKSHHWPAIELVRAPEVWIYNAKDPRD